MFGTLERGGLASHLLASRSVCILYSGRLHFQNDAILTKSKLAAQLVNGGPYFKRITEELLSFFGEMRQLIPRVVFSSHLAPTTTVARHFLQTHTKQ